jgi:phytoene desaturase
LSRRAVVVGAGQGGLSAALELSARGWEVTVVEQRRTVGGKAARQYLGGIPYDPGPSILILPQVYQEALAAAGADADALKFRRADPVTRVCPEGSDPVDLPADIEGCLDVVGRHCSPDREGLLRLLASVDALAPVVERAFFGTRLGARLGLPPRFALSPWEPYRSQVDRLIRTPWLRALFYGFPAYSGADYRAPGIGAFFIPYYMWRDGVWEADGGVAAIPEAFYAACLGRGVEVRTGCKALGTAREGARVVAVQTSDGDVRCDALVVNADRPGSAPLLGRTPPTYEPSMSYFTLWLGVEGRPDGAPAHTVFVPRRFEAEFRRMAQEGAPPDDPIVYWNIPNEGGGWFAVVTVPCAPGADWDKESARLRGRVLDSLRHCGYGAPDYVHEATQAPPLFAARDGNWHGSLYGLVRKGLPQGQRDPELRNVVYCGGSVRPGAGLPMVTLSGRRAARIADRAA